MKTIYLSTIIYFLLLNTIIAQYQQIFSADTTQYNVKNEIFGGVIDEILFISGDTSVNGLDYKKVYNMSFVTNFRLAGFVRESDLSDKLWFRYITDDTEHLVMDLTLEVDDTFELFGNHTGEVTVISVDTIDNNKVITLNHVYGGGVIQDTLRFIEGIGPNATIAMQVEMYEAAPLYGFDRQVCSMYKDNLLHYPSTLDEVDCAEDPPIATTDLNKVNPFQLSPNPTNGLCSISNIHGIPSDVPLSVKLYDLTGKPLFLTEVSPNESFDVSTFSAGIYFYQIFQKAELVGDGKLVKME